LLSSVHSAGHTAADHVGDVDLRLMAFFGDMAKITTSCDLSAALFDACDVIIAVRVQLDLTNQKEMALLFGTNSDLEEQMVPIK
jgi:hypothetical protein